MKENLEQLTQCEHEQIFGMVRKTTQAYTCSETGVFVSAESISPQCFVEIEEYVRFCLEQRQRLKEGETQREEYTRLMKPEH